MIELNAKWFGAKNDGNTADAAANVAALTAAIAALPTTGGRIMLPSGTYYINAGINIAGTTTKSIELVGEGPRSTVIKPSVNSMTMFTMQVDSALRGVELNGTGRTGINGVRFNASGSVFEDFLCRAIDGRAIDLNDSADGGLYFNVARRGRISSACGYGLWLATTVAGINSINDNRFYDISITQCTGDGIYINKGNGNKFIGVDIEDCTGFGINIQNGMDNAFWQWLEDNAAGNLLIMRDVLNRGNQFWGRGDEDYAEQVDTTGAMTINTPTLTVASASKIVKGKWLKVVGAGAAGADLYAYVTAISGTTITLHTNALTGVGPAAVVTGPELETGQHTIYHTQRFTHFLAGQTVISHAQFGQKGRSSVALIEAYGGMTLYPPGGGNTNQYLLRMDSTLDYLRLANGGTTQHAWERATGDYFNILGNVIIQGTGKGLRVSETANGKMGVATLIAGSATVANTAVTANSRILLASQVDGGTPGFLRISARTAGVSFVITSSNGADTSTVAWFIVEPA